MRFWDSSAVVPLLLDQPASRGLTALARDAEGLAVWWGTVVECTSAIARTARAGVISSAEESQALSLLTAIAAAWTEIQPTEGVRNSARRLLRVHPLRAADAMQLAAALAWADGAPNLQLVTRDERLVEAARREGFEVY